ncbi:ABC transporter ATP-binding protein [Halomonas sp. QX-2]|jgi:peptide/nickel transport system ATP-binding protein|uniref:ABC transporter ATP-binding protein n=1 Tax=Vreelandella sedimenti TaxID=2729618 RepID=A0A7Z0N4B4_9GAMM|nr:MULTISPECIES: ABC transporter ATP-binding protein [Halomonas]NYT70954.1 ABC transporter ATP-binding protein [Halomonas sedimenti]|tara:strand:+ start:15613 stop:17271 length:1659 start_codon:yes stop_codon:yes gene_type:complete
MQGESLIVRDLDICATPPGEVERTIVSQISFALKPGEVMALIGESGSGKTTIALAMMGYARRGCRIAGGSVQLGETDILTLPALETRALRGHRVTYIAQSAAAAFNPSRRLMDQVIEGALIHGVMDRQQAQQKAIQLFAELALPDPEHIGDRYPHQVSGGQLQRLMAAMALITDPALVILDEPTTALDVTTQVDVLRAFKRVMRERGTTALYVSHDLAVVAQIADHVLVLQAGEEQEQGPIGQILDKPGHAYTRSLLAAARPETRVPSRLASSGDELLRIDDLQVGYGHRNRSGEPDNIVLDHIRLRIDRGQALGVIGESGSGKSTLARAVAGLVAPSRGEVQFNRRELSPTLRGRTSEQFRRIQIVFQSADNALNPAHTVRRLLNRPLETYFQMSRDARRQRVEELMDLVKLPRTLLDRKPSELSGGQKQRVNLARALAAEPDLILCDEVTSALDTVVGAAILELLAELRRELGVAYLFISHDISTVRSLCDDVMVLYQGECVEFGPCSTVLNHPQHDYTRKLIGSVPELQPGWLEACQWSTHTQPSTSPV